LPCVCLSSARTVIARSETQKACNRRYSRRLAMSPKRGSAYQSCEILQVRLGVECLPALRNEIGGQEVEFSKDQSAHKKMIET
jgi:hypothetical protein